MKDWLWTAGVLAFAAYVLIRAYGFSTETALGPDGGRLVVLAWQVRAGQVPYCDFYWQYTPAPLYMHNAYAFWLGESRRALLNVVWLQHFVTLSLIFVVGRILFRPPIWVICLVAAIFLSALDSFEGFNYVMEPFLNSWGWIAFVLALLASRGENGMVRTFLFVSAGLAGSMALLTKQIGFAYVILAAAAPSLYAGQLRLRSTLAIAGAAAILPAMFFGEHRNCIGPAYRMMFQDLLVYASAREGSSANVILSSFLESAWMLVAMILGLARSLLWAASRPSEYRRTGRIVTASLVVGVALAVPLWIRPYHHYRLVPLPFAMLAAMFLLWPRLDGGRSWTAAALFAIFLSALPARRDFTRVLLPGSSHLNTLGMELQVAEIIARYAGSAERVYIAPNVPQYHVYIGRPGVDPDYFFPPEDERVRASLAKKVPAFIVDRGQEPNIGHYEELFRDSGYKLISREGLVSVWKPPSSDVGPDSRLRSSFSMPR